MHFMFRSLIINDGAGIDMHELSLANDLSQIILDHCGESKVKAVEIEIGSLSGVMPEAFSFCAHLVLGEKFGEQVEVIINNKTADALCSCGRRYELTDILDPCPACGEYDREIVAGTDVVLKSVELES